MAPPCFLDPARWGLPFHCFFFRVHVLKGSIMAVKLSFDDLATKVEGKYPSLEIGFGDGVLLFAHPLRQDRVWREEYRDLYQAAVATPGTGEAEDGEAGRGDDEELAAFRAFLGFACTGGDFAGLAEALGDDLALWVELFLSYLGAINPGEASPSEAS